VFSVTVQGRCCISLAGGGEFRLGAKEAARGTVA